MGQLMIERCILYEIVHTIADRLSPDCDFTQHELTFPCGVAATKKALGKILAPSFVDAQGTIQGHWEEIPYLQPKIKLKRSSLLS